VKTPRDYLVKFVKELGIQSIFSHEKNLNRVAIWAERGKIGIVDEKGFGSVVERYRGVKLVRGKGEEKADVKFVRGGSRVDLKIDLEMPKIVIDFGLWKYHSDLEKQLLLKQVEQTIGVIRDYLWDRNLVFVRVPVEIQTLTEKTNFFGDVLRGKWEGKAVLLDPNAEEEIKRFKENEIYIIGGIVERDRRMRTAELGYDLPRKRIALDENVIGVPDRINLLVKIICENLVGKSLREAVIDNMPRRERKMRLQMEMRKASRWKDAICIGRSFGVGVKDAIREWKKSFKPGRG